MVLDWECEVESFETLSFMLESDILEPLPVKNNMYKY